MQGPGQAQAQMAQHLGRGGNRAWRQHKASGVDVRCMLAASSTIALSCAANMRVDLLCPDPPPI